LGGVGALEGMGESGGREHREGRSMGGGSIGRGGALGGNECSSLIPDPLLSSSHLLWGGRTLGGVEYFSIVLTSTFLLAFRALGGWSILFFLYSFMDGGE